ncbi:MAG: GAF domain-containing protein [Asticcacaulis sp.]
MYTLLHEPQRLKALAELNILDTPPEQIFNQLTRLGARVLNMPICFISFIDEDRQWFKARVGLDEESTSRDIAFCDHTIRGRSVMVVPDARRDPRFRSNPLVTGPMRICFYAGAPISYRGYSIGTFCVVDCKPNPAFSEANAVILQKLADIASDVLDLRKDTGLCAGRQLYVD